VLSTPRPKPITEPKEILLKNAGKRWRVRWLPQGDDAGPAALVERKAIPAAAAAYGAMGGDQR